MTRRTTRQTPQKEMAFALLKRYGVPRKTLDRIDMRAAS